jgi:hypothetical protein
LARETTRDTRSVARTHGSDTARMALPQRRQRRPACRALDGLVWGGARRGASGAVVGDAIGGVGAALGTLIGAAGLRATAGVITSIRREAAERKPLWYPMVSSSLLIAPSGRLLGLIFARDERLLTAPGSAGAAAAGAPRTRMGSRS